ncbi:hypothetical protein DYB36_013056 [Aphanomyces astaci]|uniref:Uncharacterized protein n=1 Tax=Aphanomyces astaci TaxID=112090 RepID=A0A397A2W7_APHAT|nr:hypothetical protein DYB36_013056 [Aphanomyces astaci]
MPVSGQTVACVGFEGGVVALYDFRLAAPPLLSHAVSTSTGTYLPTYLHWTQSAKLDQLCDRVRIFHKRGKPLATLKYHTESVYSVGFSHDGDWLASASKDHKIALWSVYPPSFSSTSST